MINALVSIVISSVISLGVYFAPHQQAPVSPQIQAAIKVYVDQAMKGPIFGTTQPIAGQTYNLSGGGVSQTGSSITLASFTIPQNGYKIPDSALSDTFYITLEPGNPTKQEIVSCTTDVQNTNGTATFSGCTRGLSPIPDYTSSSSLMFSHGGSTQVIFSNPPQFYNQFAALQNTESITGTWTFDDNDTFRPRIDADTDTAVATAFVTLGQLSRQAISGASNASETTKGIVELATGREAASSTVTGSTAARLALPASLATSSPSFSATSTVVMTQLDGRISSLFISTSTSVTYSFGSISVNGGGLISNASTTINTATTTITGLAQIATSTNFTQFKLVVGGNVDFSGGLSLGVASTSMGSGWAVFSGGASSTNVVVSNKCSNCVSEYETITNTGAGPTSASATASVSASCSAGKKVISCGASDSGTNVAVRDINPSGGNACSVTYVNYGGAGANTMTAYAVCATQ